MTITSVLKDGGRLVIVEDGITLIRSIVYDDVVCSLPPTGYTEVGVIYVDEDNNKLIIQYNGSTAEIGLGAAGDLTGAEIVALLEALDAGSRLSHTKLDDVGASDHHAKYLNSEAVVAAKTVKLDDFTAPDDNTDLDATDALHGLMSKADKGKLDGVATAATKYPDTGEQAFLDADHTKLDAIATGADVTADNAPKAHEASHQSGGADILYVPRTYVWFVKGTVATGTEQGATFRIKRTTTVEDVELHAKTAPTGAALIVDVLAAGSTLFSTLPEIDADGTVEDDNHVFSDTEIAATQELTMSVTQVGSTVAGADLTVLLHCKEAVI